MYDKKDNNNFFTTNNSINWNDKINYNWHWDQNINWCPYFLPCGLCSKTDRPCPKHQNNNFEPIVTWRYGGVNPINTSISGSFTVGDKKDE